MNKIEEFYKESGGVEYDKFDKKAPKFTYYDMIGFADAYHSKQLIIADVVSSVTTGKCICELNAEGEGISGRCSKHRTDWL